MGDGKNENLRASHRLIPKKRQLTQGNAGMKMNTKTHPGSSASLQLPTREAIFARHHQRNTLDKQLNCGLGAHPCVRIITCSATLCTFHCTWGSAWLGRFSLKRPSQAPPQAIVCHRYAIVCNGLLRVGKG